MTLKNIFNENPKSKKEDKNQRKTKTVFPETSLPLPTIEFIFDEEGNRLVENWIMN